MFFRPHDRDAALDAPAGLADLSNRKAVRPRRGSSEVRASRMKCSAASPPVMNHLWPRMIHLSPPSRRWCASCRRGRSRSRAAGSVMTMEERTSPWTIGSSQRCLLRRGGDARQEMDVAVIGGGDVEADRAEDRAAGGFVDRTSSVNLRPLPPRLSGSWKFHRPAASALACSCCSRSSRMFSPTSKLPRSLSSGMTCSSRKASIRRT